jgi:hypothetical protein
VRTFSFKVEQYSSMCGSMMKKEVSYQLRNSLWRTSGPDSAFKRPCEGINGPSDVLKELWKRYPEVPLE